MSTSSEILVIDSNSFFIEAVDQAFDDRKLSKFPYIKSYLVEILKHYIFTDNLWAEKDSSGKKTREMLSESYLKANSAEPRTKIKKLKELGDHSLYISGFFSDSLERKIIDVDYYVDMGRAAYKGLSVAVSEDTFSRIYCDISANFMTFADVLTSIRMKTMVHGELNLLRLMDIYAKTGSALAGEQLVEQGLFNLPTKKQMTEEQ